MKIEVNSKRWMSLEDLPGEAWARIPNHKDAYMVSTKGRVKCIGYVEYRKNGGRMVKFCKKPSIKMCHNNGHGYYYVIIDNERFYVHRLVGMAFIPNLFCYPEIDHINGDRGDNSVENLRWVDRKMNMANEITKRKAIAHNESMQIPLVQLSGLGSFIKEWPSATIAAKELGVPRSMIVDVLRNSRGCGRKAKTVLGTIFLYKADYDPSKDYCVLFKMYAPADWDVLSERGVVELENNIPIKYFPNTRIAERHYGVSKGAIGRKVLRENKPRKYESSNRIIPQSVTYLMNLEEWQIEYIKRHFYDIVIKIA